MKTFKDNWLIFDNDISLAKALAQEVLNIAEDSILKKIALELF